MLGYGNGIFNCRDQSYIAQAETMDAAGESENQSAKFPRIQFYL